MTGMELRRLLARRVTVHASPPRRAAQLRSAPRRYDGPGVEGESHAAFFLELLAHRALNPPPSSSLAEEERLRSLLLRAAARDPDARSHIT
jgi:hypothetical protein